jgi:hypothetical protein
VDRFWRIGVWGDFLIGIAALLFVAGLFGLVRGYLRRS